MKILSWLLPIAGIYFLYESGLLSSLTGGLVSSPAPTGGGGSTGGTPVNPNNPPPGTPNTKTLVGQNAGGASQLLTFDQWNYSYQIVRGLPGPNPLNFVTDRNQKLSLDEWWGFMQQAGFSGYMGLGIIGRRGFQGIGSYRPFVPQTPVNWSARPPQGRDLPPGGATLDGLGRWIY